MTLETLLEKHSEAFAAFKAGSTLDELPYSFYTDLYGFLMTEMPYGIAKGRTGDPMEWIERYLEKYC